MIVVVCIPPEVNSKRRWIVCDHAFHSWGRKRIGLFIRILRSKAGGFDGAAKDILP